MVASRWHGAMARSDLLAEGVGRHAIERRVAAERLVARHDGVYLLADAPLPALAHESAAVLACRPDGYLAGRTAARMWSLPAPPGGPISVTVVGRYRKSFPGVKVRYISRLLEGEGREVDGLPLTSPALTILDMAGEFPWRYATP